MQIRVGFEPLVTVDPVAITLSIIESNRGVLNSILDEDLPYIRTFPYYEANASFQEMPCCMIEETKDEMNWAAIHRIATHTYRLRLYGFLHHKDPETRVINNRRFGRAVAGILNMQDTPLNIGNDESVYHTKMIASTINWGQGMTKGVIISAFSINIAFNQQVSYAGMGSVDSDV